METRWPSSAAAPRELLSFLVNLMVCISCSEVVEATEYFAVAPLPYQCIMNNNYRHHQEAEHTK